MSTSAIPDAVTAHLTAGATDAEHLRSALAVLDRVLADSSVTAVTPATGDGRGEKYVRVRGVDATASAAYIYPSGRVELRLDHEDASEYVHLECLRLFDTQNSPLRVEVTATDPVAILVATELTRIALAKLGS